jgi:hypothetical protein
MLVRNVLDVLKMFRHMASDTFFKDLYQRLELKFGSGIYTPLVVSWLMILQRLQAKKDLWAVVQSLCEGQAASLLNTCKRVREDRISPQSRRFLLCT